MDDAFFKQLIETFAAELEALLQVILANLQELEKGGDAAKSKEQIARSGRNIKVNAGAIEVHDVERIAGQIEILYSSKAEIAPEQIALTRRAVENMRDALKAFGEKKPSPAGLDELVRQLAQEQAAPPPPPAKVEKKPEPKEADFMQQMIEVFQTELDEKLLIITDGLLALEKGEPGTQIFNEIFRAAHNVKGSGRGVGALDLGEIAHHVETLFSALQKNTVKISPQIINLCLKAVDAMRIAMECYRAKKPLPFDLKALLAQLKASAEAQQPEAEVQVPLQVEAAAPAKGGEYESIRVALNTLDRVSAYIEEMQMNKIAIEEHYTDLMKVNLKSADFMERWKKKPCDKENTVLLKEITAAIDRMHKELRARVNELRTIFNALQDEVRMLRLVPVTLQLSNLPRIVRDLAYNLHKQVNLEINDNKVKIDKMVLDGLKDPIVHLLRNAIDHGMEDPEVRKKLGKPPVGTIKIDVTEEGSHILFTISDDGGGIDPDKVAQTALKKNLLTKGEIEAMSKEEIIDLIFRPGFSTKEGATEVSGRGVGLDVVRSNLTNLKGQVTLNTEVGKGTTFYLQVPLTLATERGLIVKCGGQLFVIPTIAVERVILLEETEIKVVEGSRAIMVDRQPVLFASLSDILKLKKESEKHFLPIVIVKKEWNRVAVQVDEIVGEREIVLKPLQPPLTSNPYVIGATLSGSNQIIFVLNSPQIIKMAGAV